MRRVVWILVLGFVAMTLSACHWNWTDPFHPTVCPSTPSCTPRCHQYCG